MDNLKQALVKKPWAGKKKKWNQSTRNRKKAQFSLGPGTKAKLKAYAQRVAGGNMSVALDKLVAGK